MEVIIATDKNAFPLVTGVIAVGQIECVSVAPVVRSLELVATVAVDGTTLACDQVYAVRMIGDVAKIVALHLVGAPMMDVVRRIKWYAAIVAADWVKVVRAMDVVDQTKSVEIVVVNLVKAALAMVVALLVYVVNPVLVPQENTAVVIRSAVLAVGAVSLCPEQPNTVVTAETR